jgi:hypothetical protein
VRSVAEYLDRSTLGRQVGRQNATSVVLGISEDDECHPVLPAGTTWLGTPFFRCNLAERLAERKNKPKTYHQMICFRQFDEGMVFFYVALINLSTF